MSPNCHNTAFCYTFIVHNEWEYTHSYSVYIWFYHFFLYDKIIGKNVEIFHKTLGSKLHFLYLFVIKLDKRLETIFTHLAGIILKYLVE